VHSAAQILKQSALVCPTVEALKSCAVAAQENQRFKQTQKETAPDIGLVLASQNEGA
jgi:hypothetical protein